MKVNTSKSKNAESFYIKQSYIDSNGKSTSRTIRKLGTLKELLVEHGPTRDDVMAWANWILENQDGDGMNIITATQ